MPNEPLHIANNLLNSFKAFIGSHFALNVVNSIQSDVILKDNASAFETLQLFNRVYKTAIRSSNEHFVDLETETAFLKDYLTLEQLRFPGLKSARITTGNINPESQVPSFVFQSLLENGLLLSLANSSGKIRIHINQVGDEITFSLKLDAKTNQPFHTKVEAKTQLAIQRLELLQEHRYIRYQLDWSSDLFMHLTLSKI
ncbi:MAG: histidine kinase [Bacteroidia bacterium]|nr:histidine kinase [Bacteroidia bacterium]